MIQILEQSPALVPVKITLEQYHRMVDAGIWDDYRVELLNGVIVEMPSEGASHAHRSTKTCNHLKDLLGEQALVREGHPISFPNSNSEPEPDIAIVQPLDEEYALHHPYPGNIFWLIEYSNSSLEKDLKVKTITYAAEAIPEYWVINLKKSCLIVFRDPVDGKYQSRQEFTSGTISSLAFPDVAIAIPNLLQ
jgi:Uma2 family endonuclease